MVVSIQLRLDPSLPINFQIPFNCILVKDYILKWFRFQPQLPQAVAAGVDLSNGQFLSKANAIVLPCWLTGSIYIYLV